MWIKKFLLKNGDEKEKMSPSTHVVCARVCVQGFTTLSQFFFVWWEKNHFFLHHQFDARKKNGEQNEIKCENSQNWNHLNITFEPNKKYIEQTSRDKQMN